eukprot:6917116-Alexandrium_andersonii.AAC.1
MPWAATSPPPLEGAPPTGQAPKKGHGRATPLAQTPPGVRLHVSRASCLAGQPVRGWDPNISLR